MRSLLFYLAFLLLAFVWEGTVRHFPLVGIRVDLVWLLVLYLGFSVPLFPGGVAVFLIGLAQESVGVPFHGVLLVTYLAIYFFLRMARTHLFFEKGTSQMLWIFLLTVAQSEGEQALLLWQGVPPAFDPTTLLSTALLTGLASHAIFPFLRTGGRGTGHAS